MYSVCCTCTISFNIVDIFTTRRDAVASGFRSRPRRSVPTCSSKFKRQGLGLSGDNDSVFDSNARRSSHSPDDGEAVCLSNNRCTGYSVIGGVLYLSTSATSSLVRVTGAASYRVELRCPIHNNCFNSPCLNEGSCNTLLIGMECICGPLWKGWYCSRRISCSKDYPCTAEATCRNSATGEFTCQCQPFTTGIICEITITTPTSTHVVTSTAITSSADTSTTVTSTADTSTTVTSTAVTSTAVTSTAITNTTDTSTTVSSTAVTNATVTSSAVTSTAVTSTPVTTTTVASATVTNTTVTISPVTRGLSSVKTVGIVAAVAGGVVVVTGVAASAVVVSSSAAATTAGLGAGVQ